MADIHANGKMTGRITVGNILIEGNGVDPNTIYSKVEVNYLLDNKSDINHSHNYAELENLPDVDLSSCATKEELSSYQLKQDMSIYVTGEQLDKKGYLTEHQDISNLATKEEIPSTEGLASTTYVDNAISSIPEVDLTNYATKDELNEVKQSVSDGKQLIASAITDKGIETLATDSFETMANNILGIVSGSSEVLPDNPYFIEYTVIPSALPLNYNNGSLALPKIYSTTSSYSFTYDKVEITLNDEDGTITDDLTTETRYIKKVRLWYPESTVAVKLNATYFVNSLEYIKTDNFTDMGSMFANSKITSINATNWNTGKVTTMALMFANCANLTTLNISNWDTRNVTTMATMFQGCELLGMVDLSSFRTNNLSYMSAMFRSCSNLTTVIGLNNFNTSKVTDMSYIFASCSLLISVDVSNWDVSSVTNMSSMFMGCSKLKSLDLKYWYTDEVTNVSSMFMSCSSLEYLDLSNFNTSKVTTTTTMRNMFSNVPKNVDWNYYGGYYDFTLTESQTGYTGTFPWRY